MSEFTGLYRGSVFDINDPDNRGRLRVLVPSVLGEAPSAWAEPLLPTADDVVWQVEDRVWVQFENGDANRPVYFSRMEVTAGDLGSDVRDVVAPSVDPEDLTLSVTGMSRGFLLRVLNPKVGFTYQYRVSDGTNTAVYPQVGQPIYYTERTVTDMPFRADLEYSFQVEAWRNGEVTTSAWTVPAGLTLNNSDNIAELAIDKITTGNLVGAFALLGDLQVGASIRINDSSGITIQQPDGGEIRFPADGSAATISSHLDAFSLTVRDRLTIRGVLNEVAANASITLAEGVTTPTTAPDAYSSWPKTALGFTPTSGFLAGLALMDSRYFFAHVEQGGNLSYIRSISTSGTDLRSLSMPNTSFKPSGGVVSTGSSSLYALGYDTSRPDNVNQQNFRWFVRKYDYSSTTKNLTYSGIEWEYDAVPNSTFVPAIGKTQSNTIFIARTRSGGSYRVNEYAPTSGIELSTVALNSASGDGDATGVFGGVYDLEAPRIVVCSSAKVDVFTVDGATVNSQDWPSAEGSGGMAGMEWDGTRFIQLSKTGFIWKFSRNNVSTTHQIQFSYRDSKVAGTGVHETNRSPIKTVTQSPRAWVSVVTPQPYNLGKDDDPDSIRIWVNGFRQTPELAPGVFKTEIDLPTTGANTKDPDFPKTSSPAQLRSIAQDADGPYLVLGGDGSGRFGGIKTKPGVSTTLKMSPTSDTMSLFKRGYVVDTTDQNSGILVVHNLNLPDEGYGLLLTPRNNFLSRVLTITSQRPNEFAVRVRNAVGDLIPGTSGISFNWWIIA